MCENGSQRRPRLGLSPEPGNGIAGAVRCRGVGTPPLDFAEFYRGSADECLRAVLVSVGDLDTAQDLVNEAFARAWASWRTVSRHPAPAAWVVRTALALAAATGLALIQVGAMSLHLSRGEAAVIWLNIVLLALAGVAIWVSTTWL
jgi:hypothetical protein